MKVVGIVGVRPRDYGDRACRDKAPARRSPVGSQYVMGLPMEPNLSEDDPTRTAQVGLNAVRTPAVV